MSTIQIATPFNINIDFESAPFHKRLLAYIIDFTLLILYLIGIIYFLKDVFVINVSEGGFAILAILIPLMFYSFLTELFLNGQTLGKMIVGIRVISLDGGEVTLGQYAIRWFIRFYEWGFFLFLIILRSEIRYSFLTLIMGGIICMILIAVTKQNQRLGDILAGTVVINIRSKISVHDTVFMNVSQPDYKVLFPDAIRLSDRDINTIKTVTLQSRKHRNYDMCYRVADKVKTVLNINADMHPVDFLEKIIADYNFLATKE